MRDYVLSDLAEDQITKIRAWGEYQFGFTP
jgi:hypothetical protein